MPSVILLKGELGLLFKGVEFIYLLSLSLTILSISEIF